ncbi:MAG: CHAT domain-containing protein, partial [Acidobacteriota bacterium]
ELFSPPIDPSPEKGFPIEILTGEEIAAMNLSGVDLAVLSARDTGLGEVATSEGVVGLRRAFQAAGTRTLIMSLWSVDDQNTRQWMSTFYKLWSREEQGVAEAVRQANLSMLLSRRERGLDTHPFSWAAFVAVGE